MTTSLPIGFGTAGFGCPAEARRSVETALDVGYRHFDSAAQYEHADAIGVAIRESDVPREAVTLASKLHSSDLAYDDVLTETDAILDELGLGILDLLYVHWPAHTYDPSETFAAMEQLYEQGRIRSIGVCNFTTELLDEAADTTTLPILANQVEMHPFLRQDRLLEDCRSRDVPIVAHTPFAGGSVFESDVLATIADEHDATVAQITLAWLLGREGVVPVTKATGDHIGENYAATGIDLSERDVERIESLAERDRVVDYEFAPWNR